MFLSCDDAGASDVRLAKLAKKYGVHVVFYWPVENHALAYLNQYEPLKFSDALEIAKDFEIGSHGITHEHLTRMPEEEAKYEIQYSQIMLQNLFGQDVKNFAPPRGYSNDALTEFTMKFYEKQRLTKGEGLVHIHPDSGANGNIAWQKKYQQEKEAGHEIELWGHSHEWDKYFMWDEIEEFFKEAL